MKFLLLLLILIIVSIGFVFADNHSENKKDLSHYRTALITSLVVALIPFLYQVTKNKHNYAKSLFYGLIIFILLFASYSVYYYAKGG